MLRCSSGVTASINDSSVVVSQLLSWMWSSLRGVFGKDNWASSRLRSSLACR